MINRKSQNSILFLTTLGVYLGLVLVGATPQVLAQAATAKQFSVKDEIEVKDDLDKNPNGLSSVNALESYLFDTEAFLKTLQAVNSPLRTADGFHEVNYGKDFWSPCDGGHTGWSLSPSFPDPVFPRMAEPFLSVFAAQLSEDGHFGDCTEMTYFGKPVKVTQSHVRVAINDRGFLWELHYKRTSFGNTHILREQLEKALTRIVPEGGSKIRAALLKSAKVNAYDGGLVIYAALPRGSLDSLLATDAK